MTQAPSHASGSKPQTMRHRLHKILRPLPEPINPALLEAEKKRAEDRQNRVSDAITAFSGSMLFVYVHIIWFSCWIVWSAPHTIAGRAVSCQRGFRICMGRATVQ